MFRVPISDIIYSDNVYRKRSVFSDWQMIEGEGNSQKLHIFLTIYEANRNEGDIKWQKNSRSG